MVRFDTGSSQSFLLKGYNPAVETRKSKYQIKASKIPMPEDGPLVLIPFYRVTFAHLMQAAKGDLLNEGHINYKICSSALSPALSGAAF